MGRSAWGLVGRTGLLLLVGFALHFSAKAGLEEELAAELLPIPGLIRPAAPSHEARDDQEAHAQSSGCIAAPLLQQETTLGFGPGELLQFDVTLLGIRTGGITIRFGELSVMDRVSVFPVQVHARTEGIFSLLGKIDGRMISYISPRNIQPTRMVNRFLVEKPFSEPTLTKEDAVFSASGKILGHLSYKRKNKLHEWPISRETSSDLVDVVSVVYYFRSRVLQGPASFCFEIYHRRVLYLIEGKVGGLETIRATLGLKRARRIDARLKRRGRHQNNPGRQITVWLSADDYKLPLVVQTPDKIGNLKVSLKAWMPGHRLVPKNKERNP